MLSEEQVLPDSDFASRSHQAFPFVGLALQLAGEENFDAAAEKITSRWISFTDGLRA